MQCIAVLLCIIECNALQCIVLHCHLIVLDAIELSKVQQSAHDEMHCKVYES